MKTPIELDEFVASHRREHKRHYGGLPSTPHAVPDMPTDQRIALQGAGIPLLLYFNYGRYLRYVPLAQMPSSRPTFRARERGRQPCMESDLIRR